MTVNTPPYERATEGRDVMKVQELYDRLGGLLPEYADKEVIEGGDFRGLSRILGPVPPNPGDTEADRKLLDTVSLEFHGPVFPAPLLHVQEVSGE